MKKHEVIRYLEQFIYPEGSSGGTTQYKDLEGIIQIVDYKDLQIAFEKLITEIPND